MSTWLLYVVTAIYAVVAIDLARKGNWLGVTFAGYALANIGVILTLPK